MSLEKSRVPLSVTSQHFSYLHICSTSQVLMVHATLSSPRQMLCSMVTTKTLSNTLSSFVSQALHGFKIPPSVLSLVILQKYWGPFKWALNLYPSDWLSLELSGRQLLECQRFFSHHRNTTFLWFFSTSPKNFKLFSIIKTITSKFSNSS